MSRFLPLAAAACFALPLPLHADEVSEALQTALDAYADGDIQYAIDELDFARQKLLEMKTDSLGAFLPDAPDGWTRETSTEMAAGLAMMGGGVGAEATYTSPDGAQDFKITLMADNPMVTSMAAMVANASAMGMRVERIGRQRFAVGDDQIIGMVANRILVQAEGDDQDVMMQTLEGMDFRAMSNFGQ